MAVEKFSDFTTASSCDNTDKIVGWKGSDNKQYTPEQIANNIGDGVVTEQKLADNAVTYEKLAVDSVADDRIVDGAITTAKITNGAVTTNKIAYGAVTSDKIADWDIIVKTDAVQEITAAKTFSDGTLKVRNTSDSASFSLITDNAAGDDAEITFPVQNPDAVNFPNATVQYVENISNDISADTGSTTKYPSVDAMEDYVATHSGSLPYKVYSALLTQSGTNDPTAIVLQNDFSGVTFTWGYDNTGSFYVTANSPVFTVNKTFITFLSDVAHPKICAAERTSNTVVSIGTFSNLTTGSNTFLNASFEIRVYN
jgi:hypothetical protein